MLRPVLLQRALPAAHHVLVAAIIAVVLLRNQDLITLLPEVALHLASRVAVAHAQVVALLALLVVAVAAAVNLQEADLRAEEIK